MSEQQDITSQKHDTLVEFLEQEHILVHLDPHAKGVELPEHLLNAPTVTLKLSRNFRGFLEVKSSSVIADLLFDGSYYTCIIPFDSVWGCTSEKGEFRHWPESTPKHIQENIPLEAIGPERPLIKNRNKNKQLKSRSHLRRVK